MEMFLTGDCICFFSPRVEFLITLVNLVLLHEQTFIKNTPVSLKPAPFLLSVKGMQCMEQAGFAAGLPCSHLRSDVLALQA